MTKPNVKEQAAFYVTRLYSGEMTAREEVQLKAWRAAQPEHEKEWQLALQIYDLTANLYHTSSVITPKLERHGLLTWLASAASIAMVVSLLLLQSLHPTPTTQSGGITVSNELTSETLATPIIEQPKEAGFRMTTQQYRQEASLQHFTTAVGEVSHISLDDGSEISLNTDSNITVIYTAEHRLVQLHQGEVFFNVAHQPDRPFMIDTGKRHIKVLGTQFSVRKLPDEPLLKIAVVEGKVALLSANAENAVALADQQPALLAGDVAVFDAQNQLVQQNQQQQISIAQTWRQGIMRFDDAKLEQVIHELNRYRQQKIVVDEQLAKNLRISGLFHLKEEDNILLALESTLPIVVQRQKNEIKIVKR